MSQPENPVAFPQPYDQPGMSLRDWFAGRAMQGIVGSIDGEDNYQRLRQIAHGYGMSVSQWIARDAFKQADAMLAERAFEVPATDEPAEVTAAPLTWPIELTPAEEATAKRCKANDTFNLVRGFCTTCEQPEADCECIPF